MSVPLAVTIGSALLGTAGSILAGDAQADAARRQAELYDRQAAYINEKTDWELAVLNESLNRELAILDAGRANEFAAQARRKKLLAGTAISRIGKAGVRTEGSPLDALASSIAVVEQDMAAMRFNDSMIRESMIRAVRLKSEAARMAQKYSVMSAGMSADAMRASASDISTASLIRAGSTLLGHVGDYYLTK
ncbi:MAG: hypothetical protein QMD09_05560 [Desulfatibacillaceae bacterium]|nr:hypothetical protein [Desulfatibacillaceae bacterium]